MDKALRPFGRINGIYGPVPTPQSQAPDQFKSLKEAVSMRWGPSRCACSIPFRLMQTYISCTHTSARMASWLASTQWFCQMGQADNIFRSPATEWNGLFLFCCVLLKRMINGRMIFQFKDRWLLIWSPFLSSCKGTVQSGCLRDNRHVVQALSVWGWRSLNS